MKYIKEYKSYVDETIIELSDYLQEFFDKFGISEYGCQNYGDRDSWRLKNYWQIYGETSLAGGYSKKIFINAPNEIQKAEMESELRRIRKHIQDRLGYEIHYYFGKESSLEVGYYPDRKLNQHGLGYNSKTNEASSYDSKLDEEIHDLVSKILKMKEGIDKDEAKMKVVDLINKRKELRKQGIEPAFTTGPQYVKLPQFYKPRRKRTRDDLAGETPLFEKYEMQDLEDYLQEFFDKYDIKKTCPFDDDSYAPEYNNYYIDNNDIRYEDGVSKIIIEIFTDNFTEIYKEFLRIIPNIELRLGVKLDFKFDDVGDYKEIVLI